MISSYVAQYQVFEAFVTYWYVKDDYKLKLFKESIINPPIHLHFTINYMKITIVYADLICMMITHTGKCLKHCFPLLVK